MIWQVSCDHFLSCCLENHFRKNKERGQQGGGHSWYPWNSNDLTEKVSPKLYKNVINQKLHHITYLVCIIVGTHWNSNDLTKKVSPKLYKMLSIKNSTISHIWFALYVLSPPESIELLKYPLLPST